ncbi:MAG: OsmC family protein [Terriglobales bacterium]
MLGTFAGALDARKIDAKHGKLTADVRGEIESDEGTLVIKRVNVKFTLQAGEDVRETVERVHAVYKDKCPVYRTLKPAMEISSTWELRG